MNAIATITPAPGALCGEHYIAIKGEPVGIARMSRDGSWVAAFYPGREFTVAYLKGICATMETKETSS